MTLLYSCQRNSYSPDDGVLPAVSRERRSVAVLLFDEQPYICTEERSTRCDTVCVIIVPFDAEMSRSTRSTETPST
jgi:hypothetical protein